MRRLLLALTAVAFAAALPAEARTAPPRHPLAARQQAHRHAVEHRRALVRRHAAQERRRAAAKQQAIAEAQEQVLPVAPAAPVADPQAVLTAPLPAPVADAPAAPLAHTLSVAAAEWTLTPSRTLVGSGPVLVELRNAGEDPHDLRIDTATGTQVALWDLLEPGDAGRPSAATRTVVLTPGTYRLYCTLPEHADRGMSVPLTVAAG